MHSALQNIIRTFPEPIRAPINNMCGSGYLSSQHTQYILDHLNCSLQSLMVRLLPIASLYARIPISDFAVGAVAAATTKDGGIGLFLGANMEFFDISLTHSIHAEQSAVVNAISHNASSVEMLAISATPCGYCRQFLFELNSANRMQVIVSPTQKAQELNVTIIQHPLSYYLPDTFLPQMLHTDNQGLMGKSKPVRLDFDDEDLEIDSDDPLFCSALEAAEYSYAPYTNNHAGCAIELDDGTIYQGNYIENVAYNPSMSPMQTALTFMNMHRPLGSEKQIVRAALAEHVTDVSQKDICETILASYDPEAEFTYIPLIPFTRT